jgi:phosphatidylserine/phosphatidylglycerophosphate/cardiolipin synthase-like enzyme
MTRIIQPGRNAWAHVRADASGVLVDAASYYRAFYEAAGKACRYILISGWQFDSGVPLLRGEDAPPGQEVRFLKYLNGLCEEKAELHIHILAWDFHLVFAREREWMQRILFHWMTNSRFRFRFDDCPAPGGSHHQKFVVVDGQLAFLGGMDICEARWDDRCHLAVNPLRLSYGKPVKPYHDVQAYLLGGDAPDTLRDLFVDRWSRAGGDPLLLSAPAAERLELERAREALALGATRLALSRTDPRADGPTIREVEHLFIDAIEAAERLIWGPVLQQPPDPDAPATHTPAAPSTLRSSSTRRGVKEEVAVGLRQAKTLEQLRRVAAETGHALGLYYSLCDGANETFRATYIHSKLMIVDDRFLTIGSANFTNRSMGTDSELHASWEVFAEAESQRHLARAIRRVRVSLLAELAGLRNGRALVRPEGLVGRLEAIASRPGARLQRHGPPTEEQLAAMTVVDPDDLPFDPETSQEDEESRAARKEPPDEARGR